MISPPALLLGAALSLLPASARAYISNGADGSFEPVSSVVLDPAQQVFNFTDIIIPAGVTVSFGGLASTTPIELLATGNISIAGILDAGKHDLWIETPGAIALSGTLTGQGTSLTLAASTISISSFGSIDDPGGNVTLIASGGADTSNNVPGGSISLCSSNCSILLSPAPEPGTNTLMLTGLALVGVLLRRRSRWYAGE